MWLPRTRGDRPEASDDRDLGRVAAPHTRGSTRREPFERSEQRGCPAHAGIDPIRRAAHAARCGLPRTRGDRPAEATRQDTLRRAAPHTRGSTRVYDLQGLAVEGCPAHAGIDPWRDVSHARRCRLPRTRGDRPDAAPYGHPSIVAAPHTRGSTPRGRRLGPLRYGCPAHAGIDPAVVFLVGWVRRLPRTRGDRPLDRGGRARDAPAAPHTRGSTPWRSAYGMTNRGCPAHAGIDPRLGCTMSPVAGLPRTRGDRPSAARRCRGAGAAAPHTRGSTPARPFRVQHDCGCPAHAGIDPPAPEKTQARTGLPRTRGDRPWQRH